MNTTYDPINYEYKPSLDASLLLLLRPLVSLFNFPLFATFESLEEWMGANFLELETFGDSVGEFSDDLPPRADTFGEF